MKFAGATVTKAQVVATTKLLSYYNRFLASEFAQCKNPEEQYGSPMTKDQARERLGFLVNVAINRKAGIPDVACRKQESDYQRSLYSDCMAVRNHVNHRYSIHRFATKEILARYSHLLSPREEY